MQSNFIEITLRHGCENCNFFIKETLTQVFSCEFAKFLRTPFLRNTSGRLLLSIVRFFSFAFFFMNWMNQCLVKIIREDTFSKTGIIIFVWHGCCKLHGWILRFRGCPPLSISLLLAAWGILKGKEIEVLFFEVVFPCILNTRGLN